MIQIRWKLVNILNCCRDSVVFTTWTMVSLEIQISIKMDMPDCAWFVTRLLRFCHVYALLNIFIESHSGPELKLFSSHFWQPLSSEDANINIYIMLSTDLIIWIFIYDMHISLRNIFLMNDEYPNCTLYKLYVIKI